LRTRRRGGLWYSALWVQEGVQSLRWYEVYAIGTRLHAPAVPSCHRASYMLAAWCRKDPLPFAEGELGRRAFEAFGDSPRSIRATRATCGKAWRFGVDVSRCIGVNREGLLHTWNARMERIVASVPLRERNRVKVKTGWTLLGAPLVKVGLWNSDTWIMGGYGEMDTTAGWRFEGGARTTVLVLHLLVCIASWRHATPRTNAQYHTLNYEPSV